MIGKAERECRAVRRLPPGTLGSRASRSSCKRSRTTAGASAVHRYYDPTTGQFLTVDPLVSQTGQPFSYTNDDPVNGSDPSGLICADALDPFSSGFGQCWSSGYATAGKAASVGLVGASIGVGDTIQACGTFLASLNPSNLASPPGGWGEPNIDDPNSFRGLSPQQADEAFPPNWKRSPTSGPGGTRISNPDAPGEQGRIMPGNPDDPNPVKQGPYLRISKNGKVSDPIPLQGNPTLGDP